MKDAIDWLVFDLGGVLVDVAPSQVTLGRLARRSETPQEELAALLRERFTETPFSLAERFQIGELDEAGFHRELNDALRRPLAFDELIGELEAMLLGEKADTLALLERVGGQTRLACYSNTNATHWRYMAQNFSFWRYFEHAFASQEIGLTKPDARGFAHIAETLESEPQHCLLIDDRQVNIDGARAAGWQALRFESADRLALDLQARGLRGVGAA